MRALLAAHGSAALALFRAALRLSGAPVGDDAAVCAAVAEAAGFSAEPFAAAVAQRRGTEEVPKDKLPAVVEAMAPYGREIARLTRELAEARAAVLHPTARAYLEASREWLSDADDDRDIVLTVFGAREYQYLKPALFSDQMRQQLMLFIAIDGMDFLSDHFDG